MKPRQLWRCATFVIAAGQQQRMDYEMSTGPGWQPGGIP
jgi:hypothetical protein